MGSLFSPTDLTLSDLERSFIQVLNDRRPVFCKLYIFSSNVWQSGCHKREFVGGVVFHCPSGLFVNQNFAQSHLFELMPYFDHCNTYLKTSSYGMEIWICKAHFLPKSYAIMVTEGWQNKGHRAYVQVWIRNLDSFVNDMKAVWHLSHFINCNWLFLNNIFLAEMSFASPNLHTIAVYFQSINHVNSLIVMVIIA